MEFEKSGCFRQHNDNSKYVQSEIIYIKKVKFSIDVHITASVFDSIRI